MNFGIMKTCWFTLKECQKGPWKVVEQEGETSRRRETKLERKNPVINTNYGKWTGSPKQGSGECLVSKRVGENDGS